MADARPAALTTAGAVRAALVVDAALDRVALEGERSFARVRIGALVALLLLWLLLVATGPGLDRTSLLLLLLMGGSLAVAVVVALVVRRTARATRRLALVSILADTVGAGAVLVLVARAPPPDYIGVFHITGLPIVALAVAAAGLRLSRRNAVIAGVVAAVVVVVAYACDRAWNPHSQEAARHLAITLVLVGIATGIAVLAAVRTRRVALEAAQQTLLAERARLHLGAYVSEEVAALSLKNDEVRLGGERLRCAVLFTDLRNFTGQSESADPQAMVSAINSYFEAMVACVKQHGGVVDKYIGDSLMAVFGAPTSRGNDAANALRAAHAMRAALVRLNEQRASRALPPLQHGIGVHYGEVVAGNIGTAERTQYTVIGDVVNVAARLESETKKAGVDVLVSKDVVDAAGAVDVDVDVVVVGDDAGIVVKGREAPVRVRTLAEAQQLR